MAIATQGNEMIPMLADIANDEIASLEQLAAIQTQNPPSNVYIPFAENTYDIDLNTRIINGPLTLGLQRDHKSLVIYFKVDRYYDYMDLSNTVCLVEYKTPNDEPGSAPHVFIVPYYDTYRYAQENKMIFPWVVGGAATLADGIIEYAVRFYKIGNVDGQTSLIYNLNTLPATSKVIGSMEVTNAIMNAEYDIPIEKYEELMAQLQDHQVYWTVLS